jgi:tRNA (guanine6-N2)-methyltransferase
VTARHLVELEAVPGLVPVLLEEVTELGLGPVVGEAGPGSLRLEPLRPLARMAEARTARDGFLVLIFDVPRPRGLLGEEHLRRLVSAVQAVSSASPAPFTGFRFSAAGSGSAVFARLAGELAARTGLEHLAEDGELVIRVRRSTPGWEVLIRLRPRPLSARTWRMTGFPGALEASTAAAMVRLAGGPGRDVADLCCGSGTILIEALAAGRGDRLAVGVDRDPPALAAARRNLESWAGGRDRTGQLVRSDVSGTGLRSGSLDLIWSNPPWGHQFGRHHLADRLHDDLLTESARIARRQARLVVITHELRRFQAALGRQRHWMIRRRDQLDLRGHHPCIWVLSPTG